MDNKAGDLERVTEADKDGESACRGNEPYLQQHSENPVEWGEEAFSAARERDVPIFLSVGYAACHWCHEVAPVTAVGEI